MESHTGSPQMTPEGVSNVPDYILLSIGRFKDRVAMVDAESNRELTFCEITQRTTRFELILRNAGVRKGDVIVIMSKNSVDYCWILLGCLAARGACALLNHTSTPRELEHVLNILKPCVIIAPELTAQQLAVFTEKKCVRLIYTDNLGSGSDKTSSYHELQTLTLGMGASPITKHRTLFGATLDEPAFLLQSSGTTGLPKSIVLKHKNIIAALDMSGKFMRYDGIAMGLMPFYHAYGLGLMLMSLCEGGKMVVVPKFSLQPFLKTISTFKITHLHLVPSLVITLGKSNDVKKSSLSSVREVVTGAGPITLDQQRALKNKLPSSGRIFHCYGMTETTFVVCFGEMREDKPGSMGRLVEGIRAKIVKENGELAGHGEVGELLVRGLMVFGGYLNDEENTKEILDDAKCLHTGDLVFRDEDGYYYHVERKKQMIKYQGYQISPTEIEMTLLLHNGVEDVAVVGLEHEVFGEVPCAFVVPKKDCQIEDKELLNLVKNELSPFKQLRGGVRYVKSIPRTGSGKVMRGLLKSMSCKDEST